MNDNNTTPDNITSSTTDTRVVPGTTRGRRRGAVFGVTGGLLAGGAIGLAFAAPSITSAASDPTVDVAEAVPAAASSERLRTLLDPLVADGTLTTEQADAVAEHLVDHGPERGRGERRGPGRVGRHADGSVVAEAIGIDVDTLHAELRAGSSIAEIAAANDVDAQVVVDALVAAAEVRLDEAIANGRLTDEQAAVRLAELAERMSDRVEWSRPVAGD